jgi:predicted metal-dependent phosphoesterase TrpH
MVESLDEAGYGLSLDDVLELAASSPGFRGPQGAVGRSHIARALVDAGHVESVQDAFERLIGRTNPHYVRKPLSPPDDVVRAIRSAGGAPVIAHPGVNDVEQTVPELIDVGLVGIEVNHFEHDAVQRERLAALAESLDLVATGGTDYHGPDSRSPALGDVLAPPDAVQRLRTAAGA